MTTTTMNTTVKEMSFNELNTQIDELKKRIEELVSERETRKGEAVNNWKRHMELVMEDTRVLMEMGIDPNTLNPVSTTEEPETTSNIEVEQENPEEEEVIEESKVIDEPEVETPSSEPSVEESDSSKDEDDNPLLTPYYKIWKIKTTKDRESSRKKESVDKKINPITGKGMVSKLLMPFYRLFTDKPVRAGLKLGNRKHKKSYPDPEETRVVSADGYSPTLTYTHSDFWIWVGPKYDDRGEIVSETPLMEMKEVA